MRTAVIIPARLQAARLPGKPLALLGQVPLVVRVAQQACKARHVDVVAVATDAPQIADAVRSFGMYAVMTSAQHPSGTDRVAEAAAVLEADWVVNVQGDEPFVAPEDISAAAHAVQRGAGDLVTLAHPLSSAQDWHSPQVTKVVCDARGHALYFSRAAIPHARDGSGPPPGAQRHVGVYAWRQPALAQFCAAPPHPLEVTEGLEQLRALAMGLTIAVIAAKTSARGIDTEEDLSWARARIAQLGEAAFPGIST